MPKEMRVRGHLRKIGRGRNVRVRGHLRKIVRG